MNKINRAAVFFVVLAAICAVSVSASSDAYSTENDPLVTLSYVNKLKTELYDEIYDKIYDEVKKEVTASLTAEFDAKLASALGAIPDADTKYEVVSLNYGQTLLAGDSCEIILRSGTANVVVQDKINVDAQVGLSDLTASCELLVNTDVPRNHYIIISRGDGRGVIATSDIAYLMVRGEYQIVSQ